MGEFDPLIILIINTFPSQGLIFLGKNEPGFIENVSNLTHEFLYDIFKKKIVQKNPCVKFDAFSKKMVYFFLKIESLRRESVKYD